MAADERRKAIVEATYRLLVETGQMVTTRQIAEAAGVAEGTIFGVFVDKDQVLVAAVDAALDPAPLDASLAALDAQAPFEDRLVAATEILRQRVLETWRLLSSVGPRFHDHARRPMADSTALVALFEGERACVRIGPLAAARLLRALTLSSTHPMLTVEPLTPGQIVDVFLRGVATEAPPC